VTVPAVANPISGIDAPFISLAAAAVTGAGTPLYLSRPRHNISMQVKFTSNPTVVCTLEGTIDGVDWFQLAKFDTGASGVNGDIVSSTNVSVLAVRANLTSLVGGTSPLVTATVFPSG